MNIQSLNTPILQTNRIYEQKTFTSFKGGLETDIFVKKPKDDESKIHNDKLEQWHNHPEIIQDEIKFVLSNPDNKIGAGFQGSVYAIPGNEDYVLKLSHPEEAILNDNHTKCYVIDNDKGKNLDINIGQNVAQIYLCKHDDPFKKIIQVLRKQPGHSIGVPPYGAIYNELGELKKGEVPFEDETRKNEYLKTVKTVAALPVSAYEKFIQKIIDASEKGYKFDHYNTNNIMYDEKTQSLNPIDMDPTSGYLNLGDLLYTLTNINYFRTYTNEKNFNSPEYQDALKGTIDITNKYFQALKNKNLSIDSSKMSHEFYETFLDSLPMDYYFFPEMLTKSEKTAKLKEMGVVQ